MKKTLVMFVAAIVMALLVVSVALAGDTKTVNVNAIIPQQNTLNVDISKVIGTAFTPATAVSFGTLALDPAHNIYRTSDSSYYAVDVGINSNAPSWTVTHTVTSIVNGSNNLNNHVNVTFINQQTTSTGVQLAKLSYASSNGRVTNNTNISTGGWLRIYYGLANGDTSDAAGVVVIPATKASGTYAGIVTLTLAP